MMHNREYIKCTSTSHPVFCTVQVSYSFATMDDGSFKEACLHFCYFRFFIFCRKWFSRMWCAFLEFDENTLNVTQPTIYARLAKNGMRTINWNEWKSCVRKWVLPKSWTAVSEICTLHTLGPCLKDLTESWWIYFSPFSDGVLWSELNSFSTSDWFHLKRNFQFHIHIHIYIA